MEKTITDDPYEMVKILKAVQEIPPLYLPEFIGPVEIRELEGKGRGIVTTQEVKPGQLLIVAKAIAIINSEDDEIDDSVDKVERLSKVVETSIKDNPTMITKVNSLFAGPEYGWLDQDDSSVNDLDMDRIELICALNGFEAPPRDDAHASSSYGLWFFPSFLNHDCYHSNAHWKIFKNYMFIRAAKLIPEGNEVLITYFDPNQLYCERRSLFLKHEFECECLLCDIEDHEGESVRAERDAIILKFQQDHLAESTDLLSIIQELEKLRPQYEELNIFLIRPLLRHGLFYYGKANWSTAAETFVKSFELCQHSAQLSLLGLSCAVAITTCYYRLNCSSGIISKWLQISRNCAQIEFGNSDILEYLRPAFVREMKSAGFLHN